MIDNSILVEKCPWCSSTPVFMERQPGGRDGSFEAPERALGCSNVGCAIRPHTKWRSTSIYVGPGDGAIPQGYHPIDLDPVHIEEWDNRAKLKAEGK